jgi:hypothetical protein
MDGTISGILPRKRLILNCITRSPNAIDQHAPIIDLLPLLDTGKRVPQPQQALAAEPGGL